MMGIRDEDDFLRSAFRSDPGPKAPDMDGLVRRRIRRKRVWNVGAVTLTLMCIAVGIAVLWRQQTPRADSTPIAHVPSQSPRPEPESSIPVNLFDGPPVHSLDTVTHQRDAYVLTLKRLVEE